MNFRDNPINLKYSRKILFLYNILSLQNYINFLAFVMYYY